MAIELKDIISNDNFKQLSTDNIIAIESAINFSVDNYKSDIEKENADKFQSLIEGLNKKFDEKVDSTIIESVKSSTGNVVNKNLYNIVKGIANLLEGSGIITTEKTKELKRALADLDNKLENTYKDRDEIKEQLDDEIKRSFIMTKLQGMKPEVVNGALEFFSKKDVREIDDEAIQSFLDGDLSELVADMIEDDQFSGDLELDQVRDALDDIDAKRKNTEKANGVFESKLGKGLKSQHATASPNVTNTTLDEASHIITESDAGINSDATETLNKINDFKGLGYKFQ